MATENYPFFLLRDLPVTPATNGVTFVAVSGNSTAVRVPLESVLASSVVYVATPPADAADEGQDGNLAITTDGVYTYYNGSWGKSLRYTTHWDDLTASTRFLYVDRKMNLSEDERANVFSTLALGAASTSTLGLVKQAADIPAGYALVTIKQDGSMLIAPATETKPGAVTTTGENSPAATKEYVDTAIETSKQQFNLSPATTSALGGVLSGNDGDSFQVNENGTVTIRQAIAGDGIPGIIKLTSENLDSQLDCAVTLKLVRTLLEQATGGTTPPATYLEAGIVKPLGNTTGNLGALILTDAYGTLDVRQATNTLYGVVKIATTIPTSIAPADATTAPNLQAVKDYVATVLNEDGGGSSIIAPARLPIATAGTRGAIVASNTVNVNTTTGQASVPTATLNTKGVVRIITTQAELTANSVAPADRVVHASIILSMQNTLIELATNLQSLQNQIQTINTTLLDIQDRLTALESQSNT